MRGTFFDELCLMMTGFDRGQRVGQRRSKKVEGRRRGAARFSFFRWAKALHCCGALGRRHRLGLSMVSPEFGTQMHRRPLCWGDFA